MSRDDPREDEEPRPESRGPSDLPILDLDPVEEEEEEGWLEEGPRTVLITGACGNIGRKLRAAWVDAYDLVLIDRAAGPDDPDVIAADLAEYNEDWVDQFHGVDTVVHLAANPSESATWDELEQPNLDALFHVFHAAALAGVERLVFASSNHAMGDYRAPGDMPINVALPPRPDGPYGATKLMGERLGLSLARAFDLSFVALRIGWVQRGENRPETLPDDWSRKLWLSDADLVRLFDRAVEADLGEEGVAIVNGLSNNRGTLWSLAEAADRLGYLPEDDAFAVEI